jgi:Family of unknown function (DUF6459)
MTTSAPQWPGQEGTDERRQEDTTPAIRLQPVPVRSWAEDPAVGPGPALTSGPSRAPTASRAPDPSRAPATDQELGPAGELGAPGELQPARALDFDLLERRRRQQRLRRAAAKHNRFVVVRDGAERDLWVARRRARVNLPSPVAVTRDIALALLEVEAGCRSAAQLERVFSPRLWEELEHRIGRRGGPLPSGRSLISVRCQEDKPGLADTVAVVRRGEVVRPVALRLDACGGRWTVTELRWWRNETDTARTPGRDGGTA